MKQIVVISGKGGTGKTVITASLAALAESKVMADCDVDAADLHLLLKPQIRERNVFKSGQTAVVDHSLCFECGRCQIVCRFGAVGEGYVIDPVSCEGCGFCYYACPAKAISMEDNISGEWFISDTRFGPMVHAKLGIGEENSGKLVALVRQKAKEEAEKKGLERVIVDGSPGIGCPVIASLSGVDYAIVVTEPTLSGIHDADRIIQVARHFGVAVKAVINKYDLNEDITGKFQEYCVKNGIPLVGKIPFDEAVVEAMVSGKTIIEHQKGEAAKEIIRIWERLIEEEKRL